MSAHLRRKKNKRASKRVSVVSLVAELQRIFMEDCARCLVIIDDGKLYSYGKAACVNLKISFVGRKPKKDQDTRACRLNLEGEKVTQ